MVTCKDILNLNLDGVKLVAGEKGLDRIVSWTYLVQTRPYADHMNQGNFALIVVDYVRFDFDEVSRTIDELFELGVSGVAISVTDDKEKIPRKIINRANKLNLPLFYVRWEGASFVDIDQSIGRLLLENNMQDKRAGDYLYNLLFGYDINSRYVEKISAQFGLDFSKPYRVGIIVVDRFYGINLEQDEHNYEYYSNCLNSEVSKMKGHPMFMRFLNKFVLLFEAKENKEIENEIEKLLWDLDERPRFKNLIRSSCILGAAYKEPKDFSKSYQEAKNLIPKKDLLPHSRDKKVLSASEMGIYKFLFSSDNQREILDYCNERLKKLEDYDSANGAELVETILAFYLNGFNISQTADDLFIHRNSCQYRLNKISELLGFPINDYTELLDIVNCIRVKRLMFL